MYFIRGHFRGVLVVFRHCAPDVIATSKGTLVRIELGRQARIVKDTDYSERVGESAEIGWCGFP